MPARIRKIRHDDETRAKIRTGVIVEFLTQHVEGKRDMSSTQITAALGLLKKTLPDLTSVEHSGEITTPYVTQMPSMASDADAWSTQHVPQRLIQ